LLVAALLVGIGGAGCLFAFEIGEFILCSKREGPEIRSPDGRYAAQAIERNCGATEPFRVRVIVKDKEARRLIPYWFREEVVFEAATGLAIVDISWRDQNQLVVAYDESTTDRITEKQRSWKGVTIEYQPVEKR
jgi:hypothetical protein